MNKKNTFGLLTVLALITGIFAVIYLPYIVNGTAFILGWDMRTIYSSNFEHLRTMIDAFRSNGTLPYWSWVSFLGNDFYSSKLFYFNDFFEYFFSFSKMPYSRAIVYMTYLRFLTAGIGFYIYSRYQKHTLYSCIIGSLLFTFSAYLLQIMRDPFFASFISFLPLYFLSVDRFIREKKNFFFIFMVCFMLFNSYYLFYMTSFFTVLYFIWRWNKEYGSLKGMMKQAFILIGYYMIGFMISGIFSIPEIMNIMSNKRVGQSSAGLFYQSIVPYFEYLTGLFTPVSMLAYRGEPISELYLYDTPNHQLMAVYLWAGSLCVLLFPQLFVKKKTRLSAIIITALITLFSVVPIINSIMHGFSEPSYRWMANITFLLIAAILPYLDKINMVNNKVLISTAILTAILLPLMPYTLSRYLNIDIFESLWMLLICSAIILIMGLCIGKRLRMTILIVTLLELGFVSYFTYYGNPTQRELTIEDCDRMTTIMGEKDYYNQWTLTLSEDNDHSFYRSYISPEAVYFGRGTNYNLDANIRGLMIYDSTYHSSVNDLILLDEENVIDYLPWTFNIQNPDIMILACTKYAVIGEDEKCPFTNGKQIGHYAGWALYENVDYYNLGKTYTDGVITYDDYNSSKSNVINNTVICHPEDLEEIKKLLGECSAECYSAHAEGNHVSAGMICDTKGFVILSVPYDNGWTVTVNGKEVKTYKVNGGMTGFAVESGENDIQMWFQPVGLGIGKHISMAGCGLFLLLVLITFIRRNHSLTTNYK